MRLRRWSRKIGRLVDSVESGQDVPEVKARLAEPPQGAGSSGRATRSSSKKVVEPTREPTEEWVAERLDNLADQLQSGDTAAALALRALVGGQILIREIREPERKRYFTQGIFVIRSVQVVRAVGLLSAATTENDALTKDDSGEQIVLEFREAPISSKIADQVKALWDDGLLVRDIAAKVGWNRNVVAEALAWWFRQRGLEPPDGRKCRDRLDPRPTLHEQLAEQVKQLWDKELLIQDIAKALGCTRDVVTAAIQHWFHSRGLPIPDGRERRKSLPVKTSCHKQDIELPFGDAECQPSYLELGSQVSLQPDDLNKEAG